MTHHPFELDDARFRQLGHEVVELMLRAIRAEREEPVYRPISGPDSRALFDEPVPAEGTPLDEVLRVWGERLLPYCRRNGHPRFFAYVCTSADPVGMFADAMASAINQPLTAWRSAPGATEMERLAVRWLDELVGFGAEGTGLLVSGGSAANLHGIACAVTAAERHAGLAEGSRHRLTAYLTGEGHVSMRKALRLVGLPRDNVRLIETDDRRRMRIGALAEALSRDLADGHVPAVVCASSGTANTGAIDPLLEIADTCREASIWLHIDGAYGGPAAITEDYAWLKEAFARADSLSLDPHKWLFAPVDAGCILVRDPQALTRAFSEYSEYTEVSQTDEIESFASFDHGVEMSRRFRGLKVWSILKARGWHRIRDAIANDIALRKYLDKRVLAEPELEPLGSDLSICCFRFRPCPAASFRGRDSADGAAADVSQPAFDAGDSAVAVEASDAAVDAVNRGIVETLIQEGRCYLSPTRLDGRYALRACIVNFRTTRADIDLLVDEILRIGRSLAPE